MTSDRDQRENRPARSSNEEMTGDNPPPTSIRPMDAERIAALIDGRLSVDERNALLSELEASPAAFEAYADAVAALREGEEESIPAIGPGVPTERRAPRGFRSYASVIGLAAALVIAVGIPLMRRGRAQELGAPHTLVASLQPTGDAATIWQRTPWNELRGANDALSARARAVRIGARIVDLEFLARARDTSLVRVALQVASLLDGIPAGGVAASAYRSLADQGTNATNDALRRAASNAEQVAGIAEVRVGSWIEAARVAAAQRDPSFFQSAHLVEVERTISSFRGVSPAVSPALSELARLLDESPRDWPSIENALSLLLREVATG